MANKVIIPCKSSGFLIDTACPHSFVVSSASDFISQAKTHYKNPDSKHTEPGNKDSEFADGIDSAESFNQIDDDYITELIDGGKATKY